MAMVVRVHATLTRQVSVAALCNDLAYLLLTKHGSAAYMTVADGFSAPVVAVAATLRFMGPYREDPSLFVYLGCAVTTLGMLAWARGEQALELEDLAAAKAKALGGGIAVRAWPASRCLAEGTAPPNTPNISAIGK